MSNSFPKILYKYRYWDEDYNSRILTNNEIYFSSPSMFNDPFDCNVPFRYDLLSKKEVIPRSREMLKRDEPKFNRHQIRKESKSLLKYGYRKNPEKQYKYQVEYREKHFGICSLTTDPKNIVMWSHYSDSHKGFCVGFYTDKLVDFVRSCSSNNGPLIDLLKVKYQKEYPILNPNDFDDDVEFMVEPLIIKSNNYKYEDEFRLTSINGNKFSINIPEEIYAEVILGCQISKRNREAIKSILKVNFHNTKLFYSKMSKEEYALDLKQIKFGKIKSKKT